MTIYWISFWEVNSWKKREETNVQKIDRRIKSWSKNDPFSELLTFSIFHKIPKNKLNIKYPKRNQTSKSIEQSLIEWHIDCKIESYSNSYKHEPKKVSLNRTSKSEKKTFSNLEANEQTFHH